MRTYESSFLETRSYWRMHSESVALDALLHVQSIQRAYPHLCLDVYPINQ